MLCRTARCLVLAASLIVPGTALATPVQFIFTTTIDPGPTIEGVAGGNTLTVTVVADNGNSTLISQQWLLAHVLSATASVGSYSATYVSPHALLSGVDPAFATNAGGTLSHQDYFNSGPNNTDAFSSTADSNVAFFGNAIIDSHGHAANFPSRGSGGSASALAGWSVIPEPSTLSLTALGLLAFGALRRTRVRSSSCTRRRR